MNLHLLQYVTLSHFSVVSVQIPDRDLIRSRIEYDVTDWIRSSVNYCYIDQDVAMCATCSDLNWNGEIGPCLVQPHNQLPGRPRAIAPWEQR